MKKLIPIILILALSIQLVSALNLRDYLTQYYNFENTTELVSGNFNLTNLQGSPTFQSYGGLIGKSGNITLNNNFRIANNTDMDIVKRKNNTINFWVYQTTTTNDQRLLHYNSSTSWKLEYINPPGNITLDDLVAPAITIPYNTSTWRMITLVANGTQVTLYSNGIRIGNASYGASTNSGDMFIGTNGQLTSDLDALVDELGFWNRTLDDTEISQLYNGGLGLSLLGSVQLLSPTNNLSISDANYPFQARMFSLTGMNLTNTTLYIWNNSGQVFSNNFTLISGIENLTTFTMDAFSVGYYSYNFQSCQANATNTVCIFAPKNYSFLIGAVEYQNPTNSTTYETSMEYFSSNFSMFSSNSPSSANLYYAGTRYSATVSLINGNNYSVSKSINIPTGVTTNNWSWEIIFSSGFRQNFTTRTQPVYLINYSLCGASPQNFPYLNLTFKNETALQQNVFATITSSFDYWLGTGEINKSFSYSNSAENQSYAFCFSPRNRTLGLAPTVQYANSYSSTRTWETGSSSYVNVTNNTVLYLLPSSAGLFVTFQVIDAAESGVAGAVITVERSGFGLIESRVTDSAGTATFFLDPFATYTITVVKTGFSTFQTSLNPTQSQYTINLGGSTTTTTYTDLTRGVSQIIKPSSSFLFNDTTYNFNFTINSSFWSLSEYGFSIVNASGFVLSTVKDNVATGGIVATSVNTGNYSSLQMKFFWTINGTSSNGTRIWSIQNTQNTDWSVANFFSLLTRYINPSNSPDNTGIFGITQVSLTIIIFITIFLFVGTMSYQFSITSPAAISFMIFALVAFFDVGLNLIAQPIGAIDHAATFLIGLVMIGLIIREVS